MEIALHPNFLLLNLNSVSNVPEKLDQPGRPKEFEKSNLQQLCHVDNAADNCDKVKCVPRVLEVVLKRKTGISLVLLVQMCFKKV